MAPKSPWKQKATAKPNATPHGSGPAPSSEPTASLPIDYAEEQANEVEALKAIYMDDFEEVEVKSAWNRPTDCSFRLKLRAESDQETFVWLSARLTASYPKTTPVLSVQGLDGYHERTQKRVLGIVENRPRQLLNGGVIMHDISIEIQDALEDAVQARQQGTLPSLEDERASAEEVAGALAKQAEEAEMRRQQEAQDREDRTLKQRFDEEVHRQREKRKSIKPTDGGERAAIANAIASDVVTFDVPATLPVDGGTVRFHTVSIVSPLSQQHERQTFLAKPQTTSTTASALVVVKKMTIRKSRQDTMELESILASIQPLRHSGILSMLAYRIDKIDDLRSELVVCNEHADRGTLHELLELGGIHASKARQFTTELLEGLEYLHHKGVSHGTVSTRTIEIISRPSVSPRLTDFGYSQLLQENSSLPPKWRAPESDSPPGAMQRKSDIWDFGAVVAQMFLGLQVVNQHNSPQLLLSKLDLSETFDDLLQRMFTVDARKRPSAFELLPAEFLRTDDAVMDDTPLTLPVSSRNRTNSGFDSPVKRRSRHNSSSLLEPMSRYANDFTEIGRLGKGGFGEVVKARNKLDGGVYAVKKIKQAPQLLHQVISEVMLLNRLNHPYVVRYFSTWVEEDFSGAIVEESSTATETTETTTTTTETEAATDDDDEESDGPRMDFGYQSTGGLDFISSSGYPQVEFGDDSDDDSSEDLANNDPRSPTAGESALESPDRSDDENVHIRKPRANSRRAPSTLYIQMEYCERHTLRDLIRRTMDPDDAWRYVRQITEGLSHVHGHGIIHRDLKPDNVFLDVAGNPKIGDFGLATTSQYHYVDRSTAVSGGQSGNDMTRSVGTALYVAPELRSASGTSYNDKVDMYSLGVIFYEMCQPFSTAMERIRALQKIREKDRELPADYLASGEKAAQGKLISCLISHKPSERPSSTELLRSDILPLKIEDETIRQTLSGLSDPRSPYHQKMMSALFSHDSVQTYQVKAMAWDAAAASGAESASKLRLRSMAKQSLESIFRRHGAEEARRQSIFPRSGYYTNANLVQMLDASGNLLQLPYDLTLPHARQLARQPPETRCTYTFGNAYRDTFSGGPPRVSEEVDFDIADASEEDNLSVSDAEVLKVMDEVLWELPLFVSSINTVFHVNHSAILNAVLEHCRVPIAQQPAVKEIISRLGFHQHTWTKVRVELRKFGLPDTTLDDLQQFDFRELFDTAIPRLRALMQGAGSRLRTKLESGIRSLGEIVRLTAQFNVNRKIYVKPFGSVNAKFYEDGMLFQCVLERKANRVVIAAGGRYDSLIRAHRPKDMRTLCPSAVGVSIGLDPIITNMGKSSDTPTHPRRSSIRDISTRDDSTPKRCDVLVIASGTDAVQSTGLKLLTTLWSNGISAELATPTPTNTTDHAFTVTLRHEASTTARIAKPSEPDSDASDIPLATLISHLQTELRDRETAQTRARPPPSLIRQSSHQHYQHHHHHHHSHDGSERPNNVHVLLARHGSKKTNKYQIVSDASEQWARHLDAAKAAPILAVETRDDVLELIRGARLGDAESWRRAVQGVGLAERGYVQQVQEVLGSWRRRWEGGEGGREACVFNFRTGRGVYYDLGL